MPEFTGQIHSPGYPNRATEPCNCSLTIYVPKYSSIMLKVSGNFTMPECVFTSGSYLKVHIPDNTQRKLCGEVKDGFPVEEFYNKEENVAKVRLEFKLVKPSKQKCCTFRIKYDGKTRFKQAVNLSRFTIGCPDKYSHIR